MWERKQEEWEEEEAGGVGGRRRSGRGRSRLIAEEPDVGSIP